MAEFITVSVRGVARTERKLKVAEQEAHDALVSEMRRLSVRMQAVFVAHAPGGLSRSIHIRPDLANVKRPGFSLHVNATDPRTGYNYLGVTRFGHRRKIIRPRADRGKASVVATHVLRGVPGSKRQSALRIETKHGVIFRHYVKGTVRHRDWVAEGRAEAGPLVEAATRRAGRRITSRIG